MGTNGARVRPCQSVVWTLRTCPSPGPGQTRWSPHLRPRLPQTWSPRPCQSSRSTPPATRSEGAGSRWRWRPFPIWWGWREWRELCVVGRELVVWIERLIRVIGATLFGMCGSAARGSSHARVGRRARDRQRAGRTHLCLSLYLLPFLFPAEICRYRTLVGIIDQVLLWRGYRPCGSHLDFSGVPWSRLGASDPTRTPGSPGLPRDGLVLGGHLRVGGRAQVVGVIGVAGLVLGRSAVATFQGSGWPLFPWRRFAARSAWRWPARPLPGAAQPLPCTPSSRRWTLQPVRIQPVLRVVGVLWGATEGCKGCWGLPAGTQNARDSWGSWTTERNAGARIKKRACMEWASCTIG